MLNLFTHYLILNAVQFALVWRKVGHKAWVFGRIGADAVINSADICSVIYDYAPFHSAKGLEIG